LNPINPRQEQFCQFYTATANATLAAQRAGYEIRGARKQGSRLMADNRILARIAELRAIVARNHCADAEQLMAKLEVVFSRAVETLEWGAAVRAVALQAQLAGVMPQAQRRAKMGTNADIKIRDAGELREIKALA